MLAMDYSNTTLVKVKSEEGGRVLATQNSNTTLVKVKYTAIQKLLDNNRNSNTTLVKVKCQ